MPEFEEGGGSNKQELDVPDNQGDQTERKESSSDTRSEPEPTVFESNNESEFSLDVEVGLALADVVEEEHEKSEKKENGKLKSEEKKDDSSDKPANQNPKTITMEPISGLTGKKKEVPKELDAKEKVEPTENQSKLDTPEIFLKRLSLTATKNTSQAEQHLESSVHGKKALEMLNLMPDLRQRLEENKDKPDSIKDIEIKGDQFGVHSPLRPEFEQSLLKLKSGNNDQSNNLPEQIKEGIYKPEIVEKALKVAGILRKIDLLKEARAGGKESDHETSKPVIEDLYSDLIDESGNTTEAESFLGSSDKGKRAATKEGLIPDLSEKVLASLDSPNSKDGMQVASQLHYLENLPDDQSPLRQKFVDAKKKYDQSLEKYGEDHDETRELKKELELEIKKGVYKPERVKNALKLAKDESASSPEQVLDKLKNATKTDDREQKEKETSDKSDELNKEELPVEKAVEKLINLVPENYKNDVTRDLKLLQERLENKGEPERFKKVVDSLTRALSDEIAPGFDQGSASRAVHGFLFNSTMNSKFNQGHPHLTCSAQSIGRRLMDQKPDVAAKIMVDALTAKPDENGISTINIEGKEVKFAPANMASDSDAKAFSLAPDMFYKLGNRNQAGLILDGVLTNAMIQSYGTDSKLPFVMYKQQESDSDKIQDIEVDADGKTRIFDGTSVTQVAKMADLLGLGNVISGIKTKDSEGTVKPKTAEELKKLIDEGIKNGSPPILILNSKYSGMHAVNVVKDAGNGEYLIDPHWSEKIATTEFPDAKVNGEFVSINAAKLFELLQPNDKADTASDAIPEFSSRYSDGFTDSIRKLTLEASKMDANDPERELIMRGLAKSFEYPRSYAEKLASAHALLHLGKDANNGKLPDTLVVRDTFADQERHKKFGTKSVTTGKGRNRRTRTVGTNEYNWIVDRPPHHTLRPLETKEVQNFLATNAHDLEKGTDEILKSGDQPETKESRLERENHIDKLLNVFQSQENSSVEKLAAARSLAKIFDINDGDDKKVIGKATVHLPEIKEKVERYSQSERKHVTREEVVQKSKLLEIDITNKDVQDYLKLYDNKLIDSTKEALKTKEGSDERKKLKEFAGDIFLNKENTSSQEKVLAAITLLDLNRGKDGTVSTDRLFQRTVHLDALRNEPPEFKTKTKPGEKQPEAKEIESSEKTVLQMITTEDAVNQLIDSQGNKRIPAQTRLDAADALKRTGKISEEKYHEYLRDLHFEKTAPESVKRAIRERLPEDPRNHKEVIDKESLEIARAKLEFEESVDSIKLDTEDNKVDSEFSTTLINIAKIPDLQGLISKEKFEAMTKELENDTFGPNSREVYNIAAAFVSAKTNLLSHWHLKTTGTLPEGNPIERPRDPNTAAIGDDLFRALVMNGRLKFNLKHLQPGDVPDKEAFTDATKWTDFATEKMNEEVFKQSVRETDELIDDLFVKGSKESWKSKPEMSMEELRDFHATRSVWLRKVMQVRNYATTIQRYHKASNDTNSSWRLNKFWRDYGVVSNEGLKPGFFPGEVKIATKETADPNKGIKAGDISFMDITVPDEIELTEENLKIMNKLDSWLARHGKKVNQITEEVSKRSGAPLYIMDEPREGHDPKTGKEFNYIAHRFKANPIKLQGQEYIQVETSREPRYAHWYSYHKLWGTDSAGRKDTTGAVRVNDTAIDFSSNKYDRGVGIGGDGKVGVGSDDAQAFVKVGFDRNGEKVDGMVLIRSAPGKEVWIGDHKVGEKFEEVYGSDIDNVTFGKPKPEVSINKNSEGDVLINGERVLTNQPVKIDTKGNVIQGESQVALKVVDGKLQIQDLSDNGTFVNGKRVEKGKNKWVEVTRENFDKISFDKTTGEKGLNITHENGKYYVNGTEIKGANKVFVNDNGNVYDQDTDTATIATKLKITGDGKVFLTESSGEDTFIVDPKGQNHEKVASGELTELSPGQTLSLGKPPQRLKIESDVRIYKKGDFVNVMVNGQKSVMRADSLPGWKFDQELWKYGGAAAMLLIDTAMVASSIASFGTVGALYAGVRSAGTIAAKKVAQRALMRTLWQASKSGALGLTGYFGQGIENLGPGGKTFMQIRGYVMMFDIFMHGPIRHVMGGAKRIGGFFRKGAQSTDEVGAAINKALYGQAGQAPERIAKWYQAGDGAHKWKVMTEAGSKTAATRWGAVKAAGGNPMADMLQQLSHKTFFGANFYFAGDAWQNQAPLWHHDFYDHNTGNLLEEGRIMLGDKRYQTSDSKSGGNPFFSESKTIGSDKELDDPARLAENPYNSETSRTHRMSLGDVVLKYASPEAKEQVAQARKEAQMVAHFGSGDKQLDPLVNRDLLKGQEKDSPVMQAISSMQKNPNIKPKTEDGKYTDEFKTIRENLINTFRSKHTNNFLHRSHNSSDKLASASALLELKGIVGKGEYLPKEVLGVYSSYSKTVAPEKVTTEDVREFFLTQVPDAIVPADKEVQVQTQALIQNIFNRSLIGNFAYRNAEEAKQYAKEKPEIAGIKKARLVNDLSKDYLEAKEEGDNVSMVASAVAILATYDAMNEPLPDSIKLPGKEGVEEVKIKDLIDSINANKHLVLNEHDDTFPELNISNLSEGLEKIKGFRGQDDQQIVQLTARIFEKTEDSPAKMAAGMKLMSLVESNGLLPKSLGPGIDLKSEQVSDYVTSYRSKLVTGEFESYIKLISAKNENVKGIIDRSKEALKDPTKLAETRAELWKLLEDNSSWETKSIEERVAAAVSLQMLGVDFNTEENAKRLAKVKMDFHTMFTLGSLSKNAKALEMINSTASPPGKRDYAQRMVDQYTEENKPNLVKVYQGDLDRANEKIEKLSEELWDVLENQDFGEGKSRDEILELKMAAAIGLKRLGIDFNSSKNSNRLEKATKGFWPIFESIKSANQVNAGLISSEFNKNQSGLAALGLLALNTDPKTGEINQSLASYTWSEQKTRQVFVPSDTGAYEDWGSYETEEYTAYHSEKLDSSKVMSYIQENIYDFDAGKKLAFADILSRAGKPPLNGKLVPVDLGGVFLSVLNDSGSSSEQRMRALIDNHGLGLANILETHQFGTEVALKHIKDQDNPYAYELRATLNGRDSKAIKETLKTIVNSSKYSNDVRAVSASILRINSESDPEKRTELIKRLSNDFEKYGGTKDALYHKHAINEAAELWKLTDLEKSDLAPYLNEPLKSNMENTDSETLLRAALDNEFEKYGVETVDRSNLVKLLKTKEIATEISDNIDPEVVKSATSLARSPLAERYGIEKSELMDVFVYGLGPEVPPDIQSEALDQVLEFRASLSNDLKEQLSLNLQMVLQEPNKNPNPDNPQTQFTIKALDKLPELTKLLGREFEDFVWEKNGLFDTVFKPDFQESVTESFPEKVRVAALESLRKLGANNQPSRILLRQILLGFAGTPKDSSALVRSKAFDVFKEFNPIDINRIAKEVLFTEDDHRILQKAEATELGTRRVDPSSREYQESYKKAVNNLLKSARRTMAGSEEMLKSNYKFLHMDDFIKEHGKKKSDLLPTLTHRWTDHNKLEAEADSQARKFAIGEANKEFNKIIADAQLTNEKGDAARKLLTWVIMSNGKSIIGGSSRINQAAEGLLKFANKNPLNKEGEVVDKKLYEAQKRAGPLLTMGLATQDMMSFYARQQLLRGVDQLASRGIVSREDAGTAILAGLDRTLSRIPKRGDGVTFSNVPDPLDHLSAAEELMAVPSFDSNKRINRVDYPDGSHRIISRDEKGLPNKEIFVNKDGERQTWSRAGDSYRWYQSTDKGYTRPWYRPQPFDSDTGAYKNFNQPYNNSYFLQNELLLDYNKYKSTDAIPMLEAIAEERSDFFIRKDSLGRISYVRYPDGRERSVTYNQNNQIDEETVIYSSNKVLKRKRVEGTDVWLDTKTGKVSRIGDAQFNHETGQFIETTDSTGVMKVETPAGSTVHLQKRSASSKVYDVNKVVYPDKTVREVERVNGEPVKYSYLNKKGETEVWHRERGETGYINKWHRDMDAKTRGSVPFKIDPNNKHAWNGTMDFDNRGNFRRHPEGSRKVEEITPSLSVRTIVDNKVIQVSAGMGDGSYHTMPLVRQNAKFILDSLRDDTSLLRNQLIKDNPADFKVPVSVYDASDMLRKMLYENKDATIDEKVRTIYQTGITPREIGAIDRNRIRYRDEKPVSAEVRTRTDPRFKPLYELMTDKKADSRLRFAAASMLNLSYDPEVQKQAKVLLKELGKDGEVKFGSLEGYRAEQLEKVLQDESATSEDIVKTIYLSVASPPVIEWSTDPRRAQLLPLLNDSHDRIKLAAAKVLFERSRTPADAVAAAKVIADVAINGSREGYKSDASKFLRFFGENSRRYADHARILKSALDNTQYKPRESTLQTRDVNARTLDYQRQYESTKAKLVRNQYRALAKFNLSSTWKAIGAPSVEICNLIEKIENKDAEHNQGARCLGFYAYEEIRDAINSDYETVPEMMVRKDMEILKARKMEFEGANGKGGLVGLARKGGVDAQHALAYIVLTNGKPTGHLSERIQNKKSSHSYILTRDDYIEKSAEGLAYAYVNGVEGAAELEGFFKSALIDNPGLNRNARATLAKAVFEKGMQGNKEMSKTEAAVILASALKAEQMAMPQPSQKEYYPASQKMQKDILNYLDQLREPIALPVLEAVRDSHPDASMQKAAQKVIEHIKDDVVNMFERTVPAPGRTQTQKDNQFKVLQDILDIDTDNPKYYEEHVATELFRLAHPDTFDKANLKDDPRIAVLKKALNHDSERIQLASVLVLSKLMPDDRDVQLKHIDLLKAKRGGVKTQAFDLLPEEILKRPDKHLFGSYGASPIESYMAAQVILNREGQKVGPYDRSLAAKSLGILSLEQDYELRKRANAEIGDLSDNLRKNFEQGRFWCLNSENERTRLDAVKYVLDSKVRKKDLDKGIIDKEQLSRTEQEAFRVVGRLMFTEDRDLRNDVDETIMAMSGDRKAKALTQMMSWYEYRMRTNKDSSKVKEIQSPMQILTRALPKTSYDPNLEHRLYKSAQIIIDNDVTLYNEEKPNKDSVTAAVRNYLDRLNNPGKKPAPATSYLLREMYNSLDCSDETIRLSAAIGIRADGAKDVKPSYEKAANERIYKDTRWMLTKTRWLDQDENATKEEKLETWSAVEKILRAADQKDADYALTYIRSKQLELKGAKADDLIPVYEKLAKMSEEGKAPHPAEYFRQKAKGLYKGSTKYASTQLESSYQMAQNLIDNGGSKEEFAKAEEALEKSLKQLADVAGHDSIQTATGYRMYAKYHLNRAGQKQWDVNGDDTSQQNLKLSRTAANVAAKIYESKPGKDNEGELDALATLVHATEGDADSKTHTQAAKRLLAKSQALSGNYIKLTDDERLASALDYIFSERVPQIDAENDKHALLGQMVELKKAQFGANSVNVAQALEKSGDTLAKHHAGDDAAKAYEQAMKIYQTKDVDPVHKLKTTLKLAAAYADGGRYELAAPIYEQALRQYYDRREPITPEIETHIRNYERMPNFGRQQGYPPPGRGYRGGRDPGFG